MGKNWKDLIQSTCIYQTSYYEQPSWTQNDIRESYIGAPNFKDMPELELDVLKRYLSAIKKPMLQNGSLQAYRYQTNSYI